MLDDSRPGAFLSDVRRAMHIVRDVAHEHPRVTDDPAPFVVFEAFGDTARSISQHGYPDSIDIRLRANSQRNAVIFQLLSEAAGEVPFPQRDIQLDTNAPLDVRIRRDKMAGAVS